MIRTMLLSSGNNSYNFYNQDDVGCGTSGCYSEMKYAGGGYGCVWAWATSSKFGWSICTPARISSRVSEFQKVEIKAVFSESGVSDGDPFQMKLGIRINSSWYVSEYFDGPGLMSKSWAISPRTELPWTNLEVNNTRMQVQVQVPSGEAGRRGIVDVFWMELTFTPVIPLVSTDDETNITNSSAVLNGEITEDGGGCTERGFEYYKSGDPGNVITVKETGEFGDGVFSLTAGGLEAGTKYYFRAYALNEADIGYGGWKNFVTTALPPTVTTQAAAVPSPIISINYLFADGNGTIETTGGQPGVYKCNERGFEVKFEFSGSLYDYIVHHIAGFEGRPELVIGNGDIRWEGTLIKSERESGSFGEGPFTLELGSWPAGFSDKLFAGESYTYRAFATNDIGTGYGDWVGFSLGPLEIITETEVIEGETTKIKWVTVQNLAEGQSAKRIGIRYGTTLSANEFDVHIDGVFGIGDYKFVLTDLIPNTKYYQVSYILTEDEAGDEGVVEGPLTEGETLSEDVEPKDEFTTPYYGPHGQDYREVVKKVFAEKLSIQSIIDFSGGKKSLKLDNHLIQEQDNAEVIAGDYLSRFQFAKTKLMVEYATPMPFERGDTIDFDFGKIRFKADGNGVILFRADGEGLFPFWHMVSVIVRKISLKMGVTEKTIEYLATLELEK